MSKKPRAHALWYGGDGTAEVQSTDIAAHNDDAVHIRAIASAISRGTERLVWSGCIPASEYDRMRAPFQEGDFPGPVKYGYALVGRVETPGTWRGRRVFALHPHQTETVLPVQAFVPVPDGVPDARACLAANMETAVNAVWDAGIAAGEHIAVIGAGIVGCLVAHLAARYPGTRITLVDINPDRADTADALGLAFARAENAPSDCDHVFHTSGHAGGLETAIACAGTETVITELSWYGQQTVPAPLGGAFHSKRLTIAGSQVGQIAPRQRPRWTYRDRLTLALSLLDDARLDALLAPPIAFPDAPRHLPAIFDPDGSALCPILTYPSFLESAA